VDPWRAPTGLKRWIAGPVRPGVRHHALLRAGRGHAGFNNLNSVGAGMELDIGKWERIISRLRLMGRYRFGQNVSGYSVSLGISF